MISVLRWNMHGFKGHGTVEELNNVRDWKHSVRSIKGNGNHWRLVHVVKIY